MSSFEIGPLPSVTESNRLLLGIIYVRLHSLKLGQDIRVGVGGKSIICMMFCSVTKTQKIKISKFEISHVRIPTYTSLFSHSIVSTVCRVPGCMV